MTLLMILFYIYIFNRARIASVPITIEGKTVEPMEPKSSLTDTQDEKKPADETEQKITFDWKEEVHSPDE